ncbi:indole-3-glycerol-phosphate synthase [Roseisolibacter sp. H3M3-2]|uniref:indole-3-glycerol-phosphate synthase n=1 Tax=Roseisolibacter sp. H3M3-2 TaxID=3031323 RepID=UPI0023DB6B82|nr:indole-3-glycerol-phosphate synthase [Roseisolibacter sp. H3M3-2]MDF1501531.1 indole-3-glycerol-phosphate synthase [Roseisolibacter sp. H3M3-2]
MLRELSDASAGRAESLHGRRAELERAVADAPIVPGFAAALRGTRVTVIAEVKRRSPSKGDIAPGLSAGAQSAAYAAGGAAALSILTEPLRFGGSDADVAEARAATALPILKKDFHVAPLQMLEARALGASAALLIARALAPAALVELARTARDAGLETLVEIRDERELEAALLAEATVIGVNNRNLETLVIDLATGERLVPLIPADRVAVFESGVYGPAEVEQAAAAGADAVLVGSSLSAAADPAAALRAIAGIARRGRVAVAA